MVTECIDGATPHWNKGVFSKLFVAAEREALGYELARFDVDGPQVDVEGDRYHRV